MVEVTEEEPMERELDGRERRYGERIADLL
jgi:hypothetical protein